jgi:hypothetical protein
MKHTPTNITILVIGLLLILTGILSFMFALLPTAINTMALLLGAAMTVYSAWFA